MGERRRVVVTGMGIICPTGNDVDEAWGNASKGVTGIDTITSFDTSGLENHFAGEVRNFSAMDFLGRREVRRTDRVSHLGLYAAQQAIDDSGLVVNEENRYSVGCVMGSGIGGIGSLFESIPPVPRESASSVSPLMVPMMLPDSPSGKVSMKWGLRGPNFALSTACATGNNSIGEATEIIRRGAATAILAGSSEDSPQRHHDRQLQ